MVDNLMSGFQNISIYNKYTKIVTHKEMRSVTFTVRKIQKIMATIISMYL